MTILHSQTVEAIFRRKTEVTGVARLQEDRLRSPAFWRIRLPKTGGKFYFQKEVRCLKKTSMRKLNLFT